MSELDVYAEQGVLANVLDDADCLGDVLEIISSDDFLEPRHARIFKAFEDMHARGEKVRLTSVANELRASGSLSEVGGADFLSMLIDPASDFRADADAVLFADIVKDESNRRKLGKLAHDINKMSQLDSGALAHEVVSYAQSALQSLQSSVTATRDAQSASDLMDEALIALQERAESEGTLQGIPSGFIDVDRRTTGWHPGQFIVIAARPSVGKSTLALDFIRAASCAHKYTSMFFSLEMSKAEIMQRLISAEGGIKLTGIRDGDLNGEDWSKVDETARRIKDNANIILDDSPTMNIEHIRSAAHRQMNAPEGLDLIVIDYLQLMSSGRKVESRQQEVSEFSRSLKLLAKELGVPVIALSQLNRGPENGPTRAPKMSDIRESGAIEQDADIIMLLHRESSDGGVTDQTILILEKNRQGEAQVRIPLLARLDIAQFVAGAGKFRPAEDIIHNAEDGNVPPDDSGDYDNDEQQHDPANTAEDGSDLPAWGEVTEEPSGDDDAEEAPQTVDNESSPPWDDEPVFEPAQPDKTFEEKQETPAKVVGEKSDPEEAW